MGLVASARFDMRDAARELLSAEQAQRVALQDLRRAGESQMGALAHGLLALPGMMEVADGGVGVGAGDAVGGKAHVRLERAQGVLGVGAEDAVGAAAGESQRAERVLELRDVVAVEIRHAQVQRAVAQMVGRVDERRPGLAVDLVGVGQSLLLAERAHGSDRRVVEHAGHGVFGKESGGDEPLLDVLDGRPRIVSFDRIHT